jgi:hypothetical protein
MSLLTSWNTKRERAGGDSLFPDDAFRSYGRLSFRNLPYLVRPIVEAIHDIRPNIIIAGDRGARLFALTALQSWRKRFPGEPFPTRSGGIQLARVTSRSASDQDVRKAVQFAIEHSGPKGTLLPVDETDHIMYLDDWASKGKTIKRFVSVVMDLGISRENITYATLSGCKTERVRHIIGDSTRDPLCSSWDDEGGSSVYVGVGYRRYSPITPVADMNPDARGVRHDLARDITEYYAGFSSAVAEGQWALGRNSASILYQD